MKMNDNPDFSIEIQIKENDVNVISIAARDFVLNPRDKSLLLIALYQLKERIQNNQLDIKVQEC
jgi:hypothetical protein